MTFQEYINSLDKKNPLYYVGLKYLREVWDAARTDPVKQQMYEALKYVVDAKGVLIEGEVVDEILPAIEAYEGLPLNCTYKADPVKHMLYIALVEACETADVSESIRKALKAYEEERQDG